MSYKIPKRSEDFSAWYNEIIKKAGLAENSEVRGCMTVKPYGFAIWEKIRDIFDKKFKDTGHENAYFPLLIPKSYLAAEAKHIEGFAKECAVVTHYRLKATEAGGLEVDKDAKLEEEFVIRPTSETIIWKSYKNWIQSYRDLPLLINQWCNVMRWEMRTRLFLRTSEILWQEGHTAHATEAEAEEEALKMLNIYNEVGRDYLAIPFILGTKTENERFGGAVETYTIEALMQDGKALQSGTSHFLGQNFARAFDVKFTNKEGKLDYVWGTSWGVTTRLIGAIIMTHSDDEGLILPPKIAPIQVVIIPIYKNDTDKQQILDRISYLKKHLQKEAQLSIKDDLSENQTPGWKFADYEMKGVPVRIVIGAKDIQNNSVEVYRRDTKEKYTISFDTCVTHVIKLMTEIQQNLYQKSVEFRDKMTTEVSSYEEFKAVLQTKRGFILAPWNGSTEVEKQINSETKATIRCIPFEKQNVYGKKCIVSGQQAKFIALFAQAY